MPNVVKPKLAIKVKSKPDTGGVLSRLKPIGFDDTGIKLMLYGKSGTGKTTLWGKFPGKTVAIISSGSDQPGELRSINTPENRKRVQQVVLRTAEELPELVAYLKEQKEVKNVILDHVTGYYDLVLRNVLGIEEEIVQKKFGMASIQDYGEASLIFKTNLRPLLGLPQNVVIIAQERVSTGGDDSPSALEESIRPSVGAALSDKLAEWLNTAVDYGARTFIREELKKKAVTVDGEKVISTVKTGGVQYCLQVGPSPVYWTKFRVPGGIKENVVVNPDYDKIMALIRGGSATDFQEE